jgi:hypothetical protein
METIIGLLFILLPIIFKLIEKRLQNSGKAEQAGKVREFAELFQDKETAEPMTAPVVELPVKNEPVKVVAPKPQKTFVEGQRMTRIKKAPAILMEEPEIKKKEKIDPKKLVIYSEIMKPKYQD